MLVSPQAMVIMCNRRHYERFVTIGRYVQVELHYEPRGNWVVLGVP